MALDSSRGFDQHRRLGYSKDHMKKHQEEYTGCKRVGRVSRDNTKASESIWRKDLQIT